MAISSDGTGVAGAQDLTDEASASLVDRAGIDMAVSAIPPGGGPSIPLSEGHEVSMVWEKDGKRLACAYTELHAPNGTAKADTDIPSFRDWQTLTGNAKNTTLVSGIQLFSFGGKAPVGTNLFTGVGYSYEPKNIAWSPDGSRMAFEAWRLTGEGQRSLSGITVMKVGTQDGAIGARVDQTNLDKMHFMVAASTDGKPQNPKWSSDSMHLLYEMVKPDGRRDLWSVNADGTNAINLTKGNGDNFDGAWSPAK